MDHKHTITDYCFFEQGKAIFTVYNDKGERYTYKITRKEDIYIPSKWVYFVYLLTGADNNKAYTYMGIYKPYDIDVKLTTKSNYNRDSKPVQVFLWAIDAVNAGKKVPEGYGIIHEGKCCACGRRLTTPQSIKDGIGSHCKMFS